MKGDKRTLLGIYKIKSHFKSGMFSTLLNVKKLEAKKGKKIIVKIMDTIDDDLSKLAAEKLKKIRHKNIVKVKGVHKDKEKIYVVMNKFRGISLELYRQTKMTSENIYPRFYKIFNQIINAVEYLNNKGIFHNNLRPDNILIDKNLKVKIIDFCSVVYIKKKKNEKIKFQNKKLYVLSEKIVRRKIICSLLGNIYNQKTFYIPILDINGVVLLIYFYFEGKSPYCSGITGRKCLNNINGKFQKMKKLENIQITKTVNKVLKNKSPLQSIKDLKKSLGKKY